MARRMFDSSIVQSDSFLSLSDKAQVYYFQANLNADDRGYINNPKQLERLIGEGVLQELVDARFILKRPKNLYLIKHFLIHNRLKQESIQETLHINDLKYLYLKPNNAYTDTEKENTISIRELLENGRELYIGKPYRKGKYRLGKDSIGKKSIEENSIDKNKNNNKESNKKEIVNKESDSDDINDLDDDLPF